MCVKIHFAGEGLHNIRGEEPHGRSINTHDKDNNNQCAITSKYQDYNGCIIT